MDDAPPERCEVCGAAPLERVLFPVAVHFKGSGFYSTDYGKGSRKRESSGDKDGDSSSSSSSDKGSSDKGSSDKGSGEGSSEPKKAAEG
jgi:predicted nucleic acid-binding Zn ribbon protein